MAQDQRTHSPIDLIPEGNIDPSSAYRELQRKYRLRTYQAQELMTEKLLYGRFADTEALQHKLHMFDMDFPGECFMVVIARPDPLTGQDRITLEQHEGAQIGLVVSSIFTELLSECCVCCATNLDDRYAFLLNFPASEDTTKSAEVASICRDAVKFILDNFTFSPWVCVSGICDGYQRLHDIFRETNMVLDDSNTVFRDHVCVRAESNENAPAQGMERPEPSIEKQYLNALVTQDFDTALEVTLERIHSMDQSSLASLDRIKNFLEQRLQTTANVIALPMNSLSAGGQNLGEYCMQISSCSSLTEIEEHLRTIFSTLDVHFNAAPSTYTGTTGKVVSLINRRYMEPDLSVEMICDSLGKSRSYLSRMFKENTGMNLLDYLHTTRLTAAKKLLNETNLGIAEIAARVGYYSGWTLARVFKRYEGITPTAYRKAFCNTVEP